jgi:protein phosphatase 2C family protein 2/3
MDDFLSRPSYCITKSCKECEDKVLEQCYSKRPIDRSGSCGIFSFIFQKRILFGNVGDSRAIMSKNGGKIKQGITVDHKPDDPIETERIKRLGGNVYRTAAPKINADTDPAFGEIKLPWRVMPGRLSVSRTFGDIAAKYKDLDGIPGVVSAEPDVYEIELSDDLDFVILACDGVFDRLENDYIIDLVWTEVKKHSFPDIHTACEYMIHLVFRHSVQKLSYDNISIIFLAFKGFRDRLSLSKDSSA